MSLLKTTLTAAALALAATGMATAATVDTVEAPTGFFVPTDGQKYDVPYYRYNGNPAFPPGGNWGWTHNAIAAGFATVELLISAFDVDFDAGERDAIYAYDDGVKTFLGYLAGGNDIWAFTTFNLGANFFNDVEAGLEVFMEIDTLNAGWAVTLAKSVITTDGAEPPPPDPGAIPLPAAGWLMIAGLGGLAAMRRRKTAA